MLKFYYRIILIASTAPENLWSKIDLASVLNNSHPIAYGCCS